MSPAKYLYFSWVLILIFTAYTWVDEKLFGPQSIVAQYFSETIPPTTYIGYLPIRIPKHESTKARKHHSNRTSTPATTELTPIDLAPVPIQIEPTQKETSNSANTIDNELPFR